MILLFYIVITFCIIVLQTAVVPFFFTTRGIYDLLIPFVVYAGFFPPVAEGLPIVILLGLIMDCLSASPFGLYLTTYVWLYVGARWLVRFLHAHSNVVLFFSVAVGVLIENILWLLAITLLGRMEFIPSAAVTTGIVRQVLWALFTGPLLLFGYMKLLPRIKR
jgi:cell shape-determining protein MreD